MSVKFFKTPSSRAKFERNLFLLAETMRGGQFHVLPGLTHTIDGIRRVRYLPNRRVDLLTVDESTRLTANMIAESFDRAPAAQGPTGEHDDNDLAASGSDESDDDDAP